ncbi:MAG: stage 0 sporulation family protein [Firmicutes bacterium]|nr:stage 0 sporulation family protein [Bacillota bacterium]MDD4263982.1 stage 0 sporulation family protein [Bacillota bacterium]MDD4694189.1 stage 0 sporulation family protein [Bacillota bacterium]
MVKVVGVRFRETGKVYYFAPGDLEIIDNDAVIVETARGVEYGDVVLGIKEVDESETVQPLKEVLRKATPEDKVVVEENRQKEKEAFEICLEKIAKHQLPMKLIDVEYTFDRKKVIFYYTAPGRVDFRELVKDLAAVFRTRIELRQIGVRDEAKMIGGLGPCGRGLCCATFLDDFAPVSIKMAKKQNLSLNPSKISGVCGRLMCCLRYEYEVYEQGELGQNSLSFRMDDIGDDDGELVLDDEEYDNTSKDSKNNNRRKKHHPKKKTHVKADKAK